MTEAMHQSAPYPTRLAALVAALQYKPDWEFCLRDVVRDRATEHEAESAGLTLDITIACQDSYHPENMRSVAHWFPVPPATYDERSWRRWLFDRILEVERHEAMEFFRIGEHRPYAPSHGPGNDPYMVREVGTETDQRTSFRGDVKAGTAQDNWPFRWECRTYSACSHRAVCALAGRCTGELSG